MSPYSKAIVAVVMSVIQLINLKTDVPLPFDEATITNWVTMLTPILVFFVRNKS
jgi:hypothetical protein